MEKLFNYDIIIGIILTVCFFLGLASVIGAIYWKKQKNKKKEFFYGTIFAFVVIIYLSLMFFSDKLWMNDFTNIIKNLDVNKTEIKVVVVNEDKFTFDYNSFETDSKKIINISSIEDKKAIFDSLLSTRMMPKHYKSTRNSYVYIVYIRSKEENVAIYLTQGAYLKYDFLVYIKYVDTFNKKYFSKHIGGFNSRDLKKLFDRLKE